MGQTLTLAAALTAIQKVCDLFVVESVGVQKVYVFRGYMRFPFHVGRRRYYIEAVRLRYLCIELGNAEDSSLIFRSKKREKRGIILIVSEKDVRERNPLI